MRREREAKREVHVLRSPREQQRDLGERRDEREEETTRAVGREDARIALDEERVEQERRVREHVRDALGVLRDEQERERGGGDERREREIELAHTPRERDAAEDDPRLERGEVGEFAAREVGVVVEEPEREENREVRGVVHVATADADHVLAEHTERGRRGELPDVHRAQHHRDRERGDEGRGAEAVRLSREEARAEVFRGPSGHEGEAHFEPAHADVKGELPEEQEARDVRELLQGRIVAPRGEP